MTCVGAGMYCYQDLSGKNLPRNKPKEQSGEALLLKILLVTHKAYSRAYKNSATSHVSGAPQGFRHRLKDGVADGGDISLKSELYISYNCQGLLGSSVWPWHLAFSRKSHLYSLGTQVHQCHCVWGGVLHAIFRNLRFDFRRGG